MISTPSAVIADALRVYLDTQVQVGNRLFLRLDGFDDEVYASLLERLKSTAELGGQSTILRTTKVIPGHEQFALEVGTTATWHRNNVPDGHTLILIFNELTSDAQSLKDIFPVTETRLASEGLEHLIAGAFADGYALNQAEVKTLTDFVRRLRTRLVEPQLRYLAAFLIEVSYTLSAGKADTIKEAIADALPNLRLFRCRDLADYLNTSRGDRLLEEIYRAARLGDELIEDRKLGDYLNRLESVRFEDERGIGGLGPDQKCAALHGFLSQAGSNDLAALRIDWAEVKAVLHKKAAKSSQQKLQDLAAAVEAALTKRKEQPQNLPLYAQEALGDLQAGKSPDAESLDRLSTEHRETFGKALTRRLRRLAGVKPQQTQDFIVGLTVLAVEVLSATQDEIEEGWTLQVSLIPGQFDDEPDVDLAEALAAFKTLYGGIETLMPAINFELDKLWEAAERYADAVPSVDSGDPKTPRKVATSSIRFRLALLDAEGTEKGLRADLAWECPSDSPAVTTLANVSALASQTKERICVPVYNRCEPQAEVADFDLSRPRASFGHWYDSFSDLREAFVDTVGRRPGARREAVAVVAEAIDALAERVAEFVAQAQDHGILAAGIDDLLRAYNDMLRVATERLTNPQEATFGFRILNQAWMVGCPGFDDWALVPLLHPLKLLWWRNRASHFNELIASLKDTSNRATMVDETRFRRELQENYGSSIFPALLSLPRRGSTEYFVPLEEIEGYELYRPLTTAAVALGLDTELVSEEEGGAAAAAAARHIARVVEDYVETYPFVETGIEVCLFECRNGTLPGQLVEQLNKIQKSRGWNVRLSVLVHTTDRGAQTFRRITEWLHNHEELMERPAESYFPKVTLKVLETSREDFFDQIEDIDIVVLADVLSEKGQKVEGEVRPGSEEMPPHRFVPLSRARQTPFGTGDLYRRQLLNISPQPQVVRRFYNAQYAGASGQPVPTDATVRFLEVSSLLDWEQLLRKVHQVFNWVVCYDTAVDRFLLQNTLTDTVQVIRYSLGLGPKQRHNLTVSSAVRTQEVVVRRLMSRLREILPNIAEHDRLDIANRLVEEANEISGDIVLRAAGPGAFLNELIGLVLAKHLTERRYLETHSEALAAWVYLDDHAHWFSGKYPDLVFVAANVENNGPPNLYIEVVEAKCVAEGNFVREATDAEKQVMQGLSRLTAAWTPASADGERRLDAGYWYDQMVRAVVANLSVQGEQEQVWERFSRGVEAGNFAFGISGHAWVFCHDGQGAVPADRTYAYGESELSADSSVSYMAFYHHFSRAGLYQSLRDLAGARPLETIPSEFTPSPQEHGPAIEADDKKTVPEPTTAEASTPLEVSGANGREVPQGVDRPESALEREAASARSDRESEFHPISGVAQDWLAERARDLDRALYQYNIGAQSVDPDLAEVGPSIVRFKLRLKPGERLSRLQNVAEDLGRELALQTAPLIDNVPGAVYVSVDLPRSKPETIPLLPLLRDLPTPRLGELPIIVGKTPDGKTVIEDLADFPHLLVAGATNSGKSVFLRSLVLCLLSRHRPEDLRLLIIDPKRTDFSFFNRMSPYLMENEVITDQEEARDVLLELVHHEMPRRQEAMAGKAFRAKEFNRRFPDEALIPVVAIIDEYAQLISIMNKRERESFERDLMSLAAVARSTGIHLVLATQRPSHEVVTGTLRANLPASIAFKVANSVNSRIVIDQSGAENLLGRGDMLFMQPSGEVSRLQAGFVGEEDLDEYITNLERELQKR